MGIQAYVEDELVSDVVGGGVGVSRVASRQQQLLLVVLLLLLQLLMMLLGDGGTVDAIFHGRWNCVRVETEKDFREFILIQIR